ncbi:hypothetical protein Mapa_012787 [Marchantia paleacea]|nr:hypothetical protein Mapa_012787 [Marchantia paleacea]
MMDENRQAQEEEKLALTSIYPEDFLKQIESGNEQLSFLVRFLVAPEDEDVPPTTVIVTIHLPPTYPKADPPVYEVKEAYGQPSWMSNEHRCTIREELQAMFQAKAMGGSEHGVVLFEWIEWLKAWLENSWLEFLVENSEFVQRFRRDASREEFAIVSQVPDTSESREGRPVEPSVKQQQEDFTANMPPVYHSREPLVDRKSVFIAHVAPVSSVHEVQQVKQYLLSNPKIVKATHNILAYRIVQPRSSKGKHAIEGETVISDCDDDGENAAGGRLLHLLEMCKCKNVVVVVSRWYGGTLLGADRFKHINNVARELLNAHGFVA